LSGRGNLLGRMDCA